MWEKHHAMEPEKKSSGEKMYTHVYRCPGSNVTHGVLHQVRSVCVADGIPGGFFKTLKEAAEACGPRCLVPRKKQNEKRLKKIQGNPVQPHPEEKEKKYAVRNIQNEDEEERKDEQKEEVDLKDRIVDDLKDEKSVKDIAECYNVSKSLVYKIRREIVVD